MIFCSYTSTQDILLQINNRIKFIKSKVKWIRSTRERRKKNNKITIYTITFDDGNELNFQYLFFLWQISIFIIEMVCGYCCCRCCLLLLNMSILFYHRLCGNIFVVYDRPHKKNTIWHNSVKKIHLWFAFIFSIYLVRLCVCRTNREERERQRQKKPFTNVFISLLFFRLAQFCAFNSNNKKPYAKRIQQQQKFINKTFFYNHIYYEIKKSLKIYSRKWI